MNKYFIMLLVLMLGCGFLGYGLRIWQEEKQDADTAVYVDTVKYDKPVPKDSFVLRYVKKYLPVSRKGTGTDSTLEVGYIYKDVDFIPADSVEVDIPITQKEYKTEDYHAWVSGYEPNLDSIHVVKRTEVVTIRQKPKRWNVGIMGGYGYGISSGRFESFVGVGVNYRLFK